MVFLVVAAKAASAGGFAVAEQDAAASGRGGTAITEQGSASAVHYNPAGLAGLRSAQVTMGASVIAPLVSASSATGEATNAVTTLKSPPHVYAAFRSGALAAGVGVNAPFGGGVRWPGSWPGRHDVVEQRLEVLAAHGAFAYELRPGLSAGMAASVYRVNMLLERTLDFVDSEGTATVAGSGIAATVGGGMQWSPSSVQAVRLGVSGRLPARARIRGGAHFEDVPPAFSGVFQDSSAQAALTLPARAAAGAEIRFGSLRLLSEGEVTFWSSFDRLEVDFTHDGLPDINQARNWQNGLTLRLGAEQALRPVTIRAGVVYDSQVSPPETLSPGSPDSTRWGFSVGAGRPFGSVQADVAYLYVLFVPRATTGDAFTATYRAMGHLFALTLRYTR